MPLAGSWISAVSRLIVEPSPTPPVMRTRSPVSNIASAQVRPKDIDPVGVNVPVAGSYSSADLRNCGLLA